MVPQAKRHILYVVGGLSAHLLHSLTYEYDWATLLQELMQCETVEEIVSA